jgi:hypothetical protein
VDITIGRIVHYRLADKDVTAIQRQRDLLREHGFNFNADTPRQGEVYPAISVKTFGPKTASLQVLLDGPDNIWVQGAEEGKAEGQYLWPEMSQAGQGQPQQGQSQRA